MHMPPEQPNKLKRTHPFLSRSGLQYIDDVLANLIHEHVQKSDVLDPALNHILTEGGPSIVYTPLDLGNPEKLKACHKYLEHLQQHLNDQPSSSYKSRRHVR